jgi:hypothetical protein
MALSFNSDLGKPHATKGGARGGEFHPGRKEAARAAYLAEVERGRKPAYTRGGVMFNNPKKAQAKGEADFEAMGPDGWEKYARIAEGVRDYNNTPAGGQPAAAAAPTGVPVRAMLQPAPATPEGDKGNTFAPKIDATPAPGGIRMAPPSPEGGAAPAMPGKGDVMTASAPVAGGGFSAVKPAAAPTFAAGLGMTPRATVAGRPGAPVGVRQQVFNERKLAERGIEKRVANVGAGQTLGGVLDGAGVPRTPEGRLTNPGRDMVSGVNVQRQDGSVLSFTRPDAGRGGPAPLKLTGATRAAGTSIAMNDGSTTGADVRVNRGGGKTDIYDLGAQLGGTGAYRGSVTDAGNGLRTVADATGRTVGRATSMNTPAMQAAGKTGDVAAVEKATIAERDKQRAIAARAKQPAGAMG